MVILTTIYLGFGLLFAGWFFFSGHKQIDATAVGAAWYTRLLWLPASMLLWPILLFKAIGNNS